MAGEIPSKTVIALTEMANIAQRQIDNLREAAQYHRKMEWAILKLLQTVSQIGGVIGFKVEQDEKTGKFYPVFSDYCATIYTSGERMQYETREEVYAYVMPGLVATLMSSQWKLSQLAQRPDSNEPGEQG